MRSYAWGLLLASRGSGQLCRKPPAGLERVRLWGPMHRAKYTLHLHMNHVMVSYAGGLLLASRGLGQRSPVYTGPITQTIYTPRTCHSIWGHHWTVGCHQELGRHIQYWWPNTVNCWLSKYREWSQGINIFLYTECFLIHFQGFVQDNHNKDAMDMD